MISLRTSTVRASAIVLIAVLIQQSCKAQGDAFETAHPAHRPPSNPYQQRLSPYLDLLRADASLLGPYHTFVQPRRQVRQTLNQQAAHLHRLDRSAIGSQSASGQHSSPRLPTGRGGSFQNYLHYYRTGPGSYVR